MTDTTLKAQHLYDVTAIRLGSSVAALEFFERAVSTPGTVVSDDHVELLRAAIDLAVQELSIETEVSSMSCRRSRTNRAEDRE